VEPDAPKLCIKPSPVAVVIAITLAAVMVPLMMLCVDSLNLTGNKNVILCPARDWEILNCIKLTQHYKMH
jgi:hypothetical protein